jgi:UDP-3-O-[3-hydroxymyristoyl] glucosamine N-acyltransferase
VCRGVLDLERAHADTLGLFSDRRYADRARASQAGAFLVRADLSPLLGDDPRPRLEVPDPQGVLPRLLDLLHPRCPVSDADQGIHLTAVVDPSARLGAGVRVGPYAVLEADVEVGAGSQIGAHVVVGARCQIGAEVLLHPQVVLYPDTVLGDRVIVHAGARIGVDGFGYAFTGSAHQKIPQLGRCVVEQDVEIGANVALDRGSVGETRIGAGTKIDNLVHLGHNVTVAPLGIMAAQSGVAGSTHLGRGVVMGGQVGVGGHLRIGDGARLAAQSGVIGDVAAGETVMGFPARPRMEFLRQQSARGKGPELVRRIRALEAALATALGQRPPASPPEGTPSESEP